MCADLSPQSAAAVLATEWYARHPRLPQKALDNDRWLPDNRADRDLLARVDGAEHLSLALQLLCFA